jgi:serine/threonine protein kinase
VYRPLILDKEEFIAKKVREKSGELKILGLLNTMKLKSDHVIPLIDSFDGWAILPKMIALKGYVENGPERLESKVVQVCLGLIKGVAYLHECRIAHRDIKPDNLVIDRDFSLKIIDFDVAMRVKDKDEEADDQCGTVHWMAPEVEKNMRHSPIRADRWACGRVLLYLLGRCRTEDERLEAFARKLSDDDPKLRPSLLEWCSSAPSALAFSDVRNTFSDSRKASKPRQDQMEGDGEGTKPPNAKKLRLDRKMFR